jgi:hypothetical protein
VGIAVYVRNDPVNLVDPDGRDPECPNCDLPLASPLPFEYEFYYYYNPNEPIPYYNPWADNFNSALKARSEYYRVSLATVEWFQNSDCGKKFSGADIFKIYKAAGEMNFLDMGFDWIRDTNLRDFNAISGLNLTGYATLGQWAAAAKVGPQGMGVIDPGKPTNWVIVGSYLKDSKNYYGLELAALHETLHFAMKMNDIRLAGFVDLGKFGDTDAGIDAASKAIDDWLKGCFSKK